MTQKIEFQGQQITFPPACVVCLEKANNTYIIARTMVYGRKSILLQFPVPMCASHHAQAAHKGRLERFVEKAALVGGSLGGLAFGGWLFSMWAATGQGNTLTNLPLALFIAFSLGLTFWAAVRFFLAPLFAESETKALRQAVRVAMYWPGNDIVQLEFANEQYAALFAGQNASRLVDQQTIPAPKR